MAFQYICEDEFSIVPVCFPRALHSCEAVQVPRTAPFKVGNRCDSLPSPNSCAIALIDTCYVRLLWVAVAMTSHEMFVLEVHCVKVEESVRGDSCKLSREPRLVQLEIV